MDTKQINNALDRIFNEEGQRLVFWNDPEKEFQNILPFLHFDGVNLVRLDEVGGLAAKILVEKDDSAARYLLYSPTEEPDYDDDWMLDVRLYSRSFRADRASILIDELGLANQHLRQHLADRRKFFDNKERLQKLKSLVTPNDSSSDVDRKMIAVVVKADQSELFDIVRSLSYAYTEGREEIDLDSMPTAWEQVEKFDLAEPFWKMMLSAFGYDDETPTLKNLLIRLMATDYAHHLKGEIPNALLNLVLPPAGRPNAIVCLAQWRDSSSKASSYDRLSSEVAALIRLDEHLHGVEIQALVDVMTFLTVEQTIASQLREQVRQTADTISADDVRSIANRRQAGHWASLSTAGAAEVPRRALHAVYDALVGAADLFALKNRHVTGFDFTDAGAMYDAYEKELYRFDQLYRQFCEAADYAEKEGWNILKPLREVVEACYTNWYVRELALSWGRFVEPEAGPSLLSKWRIGQRPNQQDFFDKQVRPRLEEAENRKAYVVISDAFRYEAAQELVRELNGKYRFDSTLSSQLGVLPSYTALGMASLLPHGTLSYKPNGDVLVDGKPTSTLEQRSAILQSVGGLACHYRQLIALKKDEGREFVSGKRVVYIYHNKVDAVGDDGKTEADTFEAVRLAINELAALVSYIINSLNGNHVVITADHGFLFAEAAPGETDKSKIAEKPAETVKGTKRYLIGQNLPDHEAVWHGRTSLTAGAEGEMEFWIPKGANRFHFSGGARFVHGGAMLQEIVVPVITVKHKKDRAVRAATKVKSVTVHVLGSSHKITTNRYRFELIQMEPVGERVKPVTLKVAVYEGEEPVTNIETVTFDSSSEKMDERRKWVQLVLQDREYNKKTSYRLVLREAETGIEQQSVPVVIDRAFSDDF